PSSRTEVERAGPLRLTSARFARRTPSLRTITARVCGRPIPLRSLLHALLRRLHISRVSRVTANPAITRLGQLLHLRRDMRTGFGLPLLRERARRHDHRAQQYPRDHHRFHRSFLLALVSCLATRPDAEAVYIRPCRVKMAFRTNYFCIIRKYGTDRHRRT